jgi:uncharacterized protein
MPARRPVTLFGVRVLELWRFPVKSLQGERLEAAAVGEGGIEGDRRFAIYDLETGFGLTARRVPELLFARAAVGAGGALEVTLPDGTVAADDDALSAWLGRHVALRSAEEQVGRRYENPADYEREATSAWEPFEGAGGAFHDEAEARVSLVSTATMGTWDRRRFRSNVVLEGEGEDELVGARAQLGDALLDVRIRIPRCVMTTRPQPGRIDRDLDVLRTIARERDACLAIGALVVTPGAVRVDDELTAV